MNKFSEINLDYSINSGQVFLWEKCVNTWYGINGSDVLAITPESNQIRAFSENPMDVFRQGDNSKKLFKV
jgi:N-glycosylase/DNA lyase